MKPVEPYLKTTRAKEHLDGLRDALDTLYESKPYRFTREDDLENGCHIIRFKVDYTPDRISLIAGDFFYNLRAALDQLVWCLAKLPSPLASYPENTAFPILETRDDKLIERRTKGVPAGAVAIIESLQPYNAPNPSDIKAHHLWRLAKLCNIDKHMRIPVHGHSGQWWLPPTIVARGFLFQSFDDYAEMKIPLELKSEMALDPRVTMKVEFGDLFWGVKCDIDDLTGIYEFVTNTVIPKFSRFLK